MSILFETTKVVKKHNPPVIVIGLPRSGTTFLSHVLSCMDGLYVFDDLYPYQEAKALSLEGNLTKEQQSNYLNKLSWSARAKVRFKKNIYAFSPKCTWAEIDALEDAVLKTFRDREVTWPMLLEEWMTRLSIFHNCQRWGYKTPQDFMHLDEILDIFPTAQFIFVMRDPRKVMTSFKNLPKQRSKGKAPDGVVGQYHPIIYAQYWKMAYCKTMTFINNNPKANVFVVKFEDLIADPEHEATKIAKFLNTKIQKSVQVKRINTSFSSVVNYSLTDTEVWLCELAIGRVMQQAGYELWNLKPKFIDIPNFVNTSFSFLNYQVYRLIMDSRARYSIVTYIKNLINFQKTSINNLW